MHACMILATKTWQHFPFLFYSNVPLCSSLSFFSKRFHLLSARRVLGAGGMLVQRQVLGFLLGIAPVGGLASRWGRRIDPSMALLVGCSDHPAWTVHAPACSCTEVAELSFWISTRIYRSNICNINRISYHIKYAPRDRSLALLMRTPWIILQ